jgi:DnaJ-class molecular chaperone
MNRSRAAEIIMEGKAFESCPQCKETGEMEGHKYSTGVSFMLVFYKPCPLCKGFGHRPRGEYLQACVVLKMPFPKQ